MYPIKFKPIYKERIWGGNNLEKIFPRELPSRHIGESWELSSRMNDTSVIANGMLAGMNLQQIMVEYPEEIMGNKLVSGQHFPLLIKIIDANDNLSIQVHPSDEYADEGVGEAGKTEAWYVVATKEQARIVYGLKKDITKEDFIKAVESNTLRDVVKIVPVKAGDMVLVPAGTVHALLDGVIVYEVQQNSDTTYRVYDYDRVGANGNRRELHISRALEVINFTEQSSCDFNVSSINCQYFSMDKLIIQGVINEKTNNQFIIYCVITGTGEIIYDNLVEPLQSGETLLIPACLGGFSINGNMELLKIT